MNEKNVVLISLIVIFVFSACTNNSSKILDKTMSSTVQHKTENSSNKITIFFCGDVMTGRGIDQVLPHPSNPVLYEPYMKNAKGYVKLAEEINGVIDEPVGFNYIWGDALGIFEEIKPDLKIINLETSITKSDDHWKGKGIHYRMSPENIGVLKAAGIDYASLANNHILDWGYSGLEETIKTLDKAGIEYSGAGADIESAMRPAILQVHKDSRVIVFSLGSTDSGIPEEWRAEQDKPGTAFIDNFSDNYIMQISEQVREIKTGDDIVVVSIHWGSNCGYNIPKEHRKFAHRLIEDAGVDLVHGQSSHHPRGIEIYEGKPIIYGAGDFINDYEGIEGYENFRDDLALMYFVTFGSDNKGLEKIELVPMQIKRFRLNKTSPGDSTWLYNRIQRESNKFGTRIIKVSDSLYTIEPG